MVHYLIGDAMEPIKKPALIIHICNDKGIWGSGFVNSVSDVNKEPENMYRIWTNICRGDLPLGECQIIQISDKIWVINMIAQHDIRIIDGIPPLRLEALRRCLFEVNDIARAKGATVHAPRIGSVRSGGRWSDIKKLLLKVLTVDTYVYTLPIEKDMWDDEYENEKDYKNGN